VTADEILAPRFPWMSITCELTAREGVVVVVADIELFAADRVAQDIRSHGSEAEAGEAQADEVFVRRGRLPILTNNAGAFISQT
jgi:hypothetical protein